MNLVLQREILTPDYTLGTLLGLGKKLCVTCEDAVRGDGNAETVKDWKQDDISAIPYGHYRIIIDFSNHFQKFLPHILDVPGFSGVRMHGGNTAANSSGCVLLGMVRTSNGVKNCVPAVAMIMELLAKNPQTWIDICAPQ